MFCSQWSMTFYCFRCEEVGLRFPFLPPFFSFSNRFLAVVDLFNKSVFIMYYYVKKKSEEKSWFASIWCNTDWNILLSVVYDLAVCPNLLRWLKSILLHILCKTICGWKHSFEWTLTDLCSAVYEITASLLLLCACLCIHYPLNLDTCASNTYEGNAAQQCLLSSPGVDTRSKLSTATPLLRLP